MIGRGCGADSGAAGHYDARGSGREVEMIERIEDFVFWAATAVLTSVSAGARQAVSMRLRAVGEWK